MSAVCIIYGLRENAPQTLICYVGRTTVPDSRLSLHIGSNGDSRGLREWKQDLARDGKEWVMSVLEKCSPELGQEREVFWIRKCRELNPSLLNVLPSGRVKQTAKNQTSLFLRPEQKADGSRISGATSVRLPATLRVRLEAIADEERRTLGNVIRIAIEDWLTLRETKKK